MSDKPVSIEPANASDDETKPEIQLVAKQKTIAPVWKHFGFEADEKGKPQSPDRSKCHVCQQKVAAKDGNTSNLYSHLKNRHPDLYLQVERGQAQASMIIHAAGQPSLSEAWQRMQTLPPSSRYLVIS